MKVSQNIVDLMHLKKAERLQREEEKKQERIARRQLRMQSHKVFKDPQYSQRKGTPSRWELMQIEGKAARQKAEERNRTPDWGIQHDRPFTSNVARRGPLDIARAASAKRQKELEDETLQVVSGRKRMQTLEVASVSQNGFNTSASLTNLKLTPLERVRHMRNLS